MAMLAAVLLVLINVFVLSGVAYNRSGEAEATLKLTERELALPYRSYRNKDNSGLSLRLNWNIIPVNLFANSYNKFSLSSYGNPDWITEDKLKELGVDVDNIKANKETNEKYDDYGYQKLNSEEVIIVLEYDGEAFQKAIKIAEIDIQEIRKKFKNNPDDEELREDLERYEKSLDEFKTSESRLIAIDAGLDLNTLKTKYNDGSKYLMLRGELRPHWNDEKLVARIGQVFISEIHIPLPYSKEINEITKRETTSNSYNSRKEKPRYWVELKVGKRLEVWVGVVSGL